MDGPTWQAYVINMPTAHKRWADVEARLVAAQIPFQRIEAVVGKDVPLPHPDFDEAWHRRLSGRRPIPAEIGCYFSHLAAMDAFLRTDHSHGLFLEDDAVFTPRLVDTIAAALRHAAAWDVLRLATVSTNRVIPAIALEDGSSLGVNLTRTKGSAAYMLDRRAAETLRRRLRPMCMAYDIAYDLEYLWGLRALAVTPYPIVADEAAPSQIQVNINSYKYGKSRYLTVFPFRAGVETARVVCRLALLAGLLVRPRRTITASPASATLPAHPRSS